MNVIDYKSSNWPFFLAIILTDNPAAYHTVADVVNESIRQVCLGTTGHHPGQMALSTPATSRMGAECLTLKCGQTPAERHLLECVRDLAGMLSQAPSGCEQLEKGD